MHKVVYQRQVLQDQDHEPHIRRPPQLDMGVRPQYSQRDMQPSSRRSL